MWSRLIGLVSRGARDVVPDRGDMDDDFEPIPPAFGDSTRLFMVGTGGDRPIPLLVCLGCGGTAFHVGRSPHTTVARCTRCRIERVIHDG